MKMTLVEMTQNILSSLNSDEVNSISDTAEARQVAEVIRTVYFNIIARSDLPEHNTMFQLDAFADMTKPTCTGIPSNVVRIDWIKYYDVPLAVDISEGFVHALNLDVTEGSGDTTATSKYKYVTMLPIQQFADMVHSFNIDADNVASYIIEGGNTLYYKNDAQPQFCALFPSAAHLEDIVVFDSYNAEIEDTIQKSKTLCFGQIRPTFSMTDSFIPTLDDSQFPLLLNEAKALAFFELKQMPHPKAEQENKRQWSALQKTKSVINRPTYFDQLPDFGRNARTRIYGGRVDNRWMRQQ